MPVGSLERAEAFIGVLGVAIEIVHDDIVGDVAAGGGEVSPGPEALAPIALTDMLELRLNFAR